MSHVSRCALAAAIFFCAVPCSAEPLSWSAGGHISATAAGGWPLLDLRGRAGFLVGGGHELGISAGLVSSRLATQLLYVAEHTHTWIRGRRWPTVGLRVGAATDLVGAIAQTRALVGLSVGLRVPMGARVALRFDASHEILIGHHLADRSSLALGLEVLSGPGWRPAPPPCYPRRRSGGRPGDGAAAERSSE